MPDAFICDAIRTPIGRLNGALARVPADDLAALPLRALMERNPDVDWSAVDAVILGCANQSGEDTTLGWRFVNPAMKAAHGVDTMPQTGENVAEQWGVSRADQDAFALASQRKAAAAQASGRFAAEIVPVTVPQPRGEAIVFAADEHPRATRAEALAKLKPVVRPGGTVTAGDASGLNDGAAMLVERA